MRVLSPDGVWSSSASLRLAVGVGLQSLSLVCRRCGVCAPTGFSSSLTSSSDSYIVIKSPGGVQVVVRHLTVLLVIFLPVAVVPVFVAGGSSFPGVS